MRGRPRLELLLLIVLGLALLIPLARTLSRSGSLPPAEPDNFPPSVRAVWIDVRFSHPPQRAGLSHGETLLDTGGGESRWDLEANLPLKGDRLTLALHLEWPDDTTQTYTEIAVEPEGMERRSRGFWSRGAVERSLEFAW